MRCYKILYDIIDSNNELKSCCMCGFGKGYSLGEAATLKAHLESEGYMNVEIVDLRSDEVLV